MRSQDLAPDQLDELRALLQRPRVGAVVLQCKLRECGLADHADRALEFAEWLDQPGAEFGEAGRRVLAAT